MLLEPRKIIRNYESIIVMHPETPESQQKELFQKNKKILEEKGGTFHSVDTWGKRKLGNPIAKNKLGIFFHCVFESETTAILELERTMRINENVLRFLHTKIEDGVTPQAHMEGFQAVLAEADKRQKEFAAKKAARSKRS